MLGTAVILPHAAIARTGQPNDKVVNKMPRSHTSHNQVMRAVTAFAVLFLSSCSPMSVPRTGPSSPRANTTTVLLHGKPLEPMWLRACSHRSRRGAYASGDGGRRGAAVDMFHQIAQAGYYTVGFSSKAFLHVERPRGALVAPPSEAEYEQYSAGRSLGLIQRLARLAGSRGAAFAVLAASNQPHRASSSA